MLRILLVEDVDDLRATLRQALRLHGGFEVVADVADGLSAVAAAEEFAPDAVVLDLGLPDLAGAELVTRVRAAAPHARVVVYTGDVGQDSAGLDIDALVSKDQGVRYLVNLLADIGRESQGSATRQFGPSPDDVIEARRFLKENCDTWGCGSLTQQALLVTSELVTNALMHAEGWCEVRAVFADGVLRIEVHDRSEDSPDLLDAETDSESGRGMLIVSALAEAWGVDTSADGKLVWAELVSPESISRAG